MNPPATRIEIIMDNRVSVLKDLPEIRQVRDEEPRDDEDLAAFTTADLPAVWIWEEDEQVLVTDTERYDCTTVIVVECLFTYERNGELRYRKRARQFKGLIQHAMAADLGCGTDPDTGEPNAWGFFEVSNVPFRTPIAHQGCVRAEFRLQYKRSRLSPYVMHMQAA